MSEKSTVAQSPARPAPQQRGYDPTLFAPLFAAEDRHFWFRARNRVIATLVGQLTAGWSPGYQVLEVGCGTGNVLRVLEKACPGGTVVGLDMYADGLRYARQRTSCPLVQGDITALPFGARFELIGLFDVLEHLADDRRVLRDLRARLAPGGTLLLTVPAHPSLWSYFDDACQHIRRYQEAELVAKLRETGYQVEYLTQFMASLFPLVWLGRRLAPLLDPRPAGSVGRNHDLATRELRVIPVVNSLLGWLLAPEVHLIARRRSLPLGTSLLLVARKDSDSGDGRPA